MDPHAAEAFIHAAPPRIARWRGQSSFVVCGRRLYPFCLWHLHLLDALGNPFGKLRGGSEAHFMQAVEICARPALAPPPIRRPGIWGRLWRRRWSERAGRELKIFIARGLERELFISSEQNQFFEYLKDYCALPDFWSGSEGKAVGSPAALYRAMLLQHLFPQWSERKCWATPVGEAAWLGAAMLEAQGHDVKLMTEAEREIVDQQTAAASATFHPSTEVSGSVPDSSNPS